MIHKVLDYGEVELLLATGEDYTPVHAARVSFHSDGTDEERNHKLLRYLAEHKHYGPFEFISLSFRVKAPIFVARQWMRHRTGSYNEFSMRYADPAKLSSREKIEFYTPPSWRLQDPKNKQSSSGLAYDISPMYTRIVREAIDAYNAAIGQGVAREQARLILPVSVYTEFWWSVNLRNLLHFLRLRLAPDAQDETRAYADAIAEEVKENYPLIWGLFEEGLFV